MNVEVNATLALTPVSPETPPTPASSGRVPKRKSHTKSRQGCFQCKRRHQKCNESHPRCANCTRLRVDCTWPTRSTDGFSPASNGPENHVPMLVGQRDSIIPDNSSSSSDLPIEDMRLLHHWVTKTSKSLPTTMSISGHSEEDHFIDLGFDHPFLLHCMLAVAAVHKALLDPTTNGRALLLRADAHVNKALTTYRTLLVHPTAETAVPMFLLSSTLVTYNLAAAQIEEPEDPISAVCHCFKLIQGVKVVIGPHWEQIKASKPFRMAAAPALDLDTPIRPEDGEFSEILQLQELTLDMASEDRNACTKAILDLHTYFMKTKKCAEEAGHAVIFVWPALLEDRFQNLMSSKNPVAVIILAHFAILMVRARTKWWVHNWPERIVRAAQELLQDVPELLKWLDLPLQMIKYHF
ncbi:hypothetical protein P154DRAFT_272340 [Amniculicola lignicola CBS 123094]|uniref:Zn(2)-C6 fungal-type domain-containing protein n=1 Tax=Amniculicola lignicola CBS 123094 TaxID=1392246 RepID=A0A6A5WJH7_9PLEO|nr:hypothetical protein P154DRAFT_272340 [Amniculicola lignicola CBS 123094]